jgi:DNA polymerase I-like protein with 3'-5' exonuclease and polymerase domains
MKFYYNKRPFNVRQWSGEDLGSILSVDTETDFVPFHTIAELATFQVFNGKTVYWVDESQVSRFLDQHRESAMIFHNAPFDLDVIAEHIHVKQWIYDVVDRNKVFDTAILYKLWHLANVGFVPFKSSLDHLSRTLIGETLVKDDSVRCNFMQFKGKPISEIPEEFVEYGSKDVVATWDAYFVLTSRIKKYDTMGTLLSHHIQIKGAVALEHIYKNGIRIDLKAKDEKLKEMNAELEKQGDILATYGWVRGVKGLKERYENIVSALGISDLLPRTEDGSISSKREDLEKFDHLPFVRAHLDYMEVEKASTFIRDLNTERIHPRYGAILNTGRTSCSGGKSAVNIQQIPRVGGIREIFIPEEGKKFVDIDYSALELAGLAQVCITKFGYSKMGDLINEGKCLHYYTASNVYRKPESEVTKDERQFAKIPNFAFPTNMSPSTFVSYCKGYNVPMTEEQGEQVKRAYAETYPEISQEFWNVPYGENSVMTLTGRLRANCSYTAYLNTQFQGLCADGAKLALYEVDKAGYKIVAFIHDQIMVEVADGLALDALDTVSKIMVESMQQVIPDVKISVEGEILERWKK